MARVKLINRLLGLFFIVMLISSPLFIADGQFLPFGRNKISYFNFDWHILRTDHFDIYFYPEMEDLARRGASYAEASYKELEQKFNFTIDKRIPLIFYSSTIHFQQTNVTTGFIPEGVGGFFEFLKGRVVIPCMGSMNQFRHVITHELVHVFMHNKIEQVLREHNLPNERYPPLWFVEGLAEYYSTQWDSQAEMLLRDAVLNNYFVPLSNIYAITGSFLMYKEGQAALSFISEEFGSETIIQMIDNLWKSADFNEVMKITIGKTYEEFDREWLRHLKKRYYPLLTEKERPGDVTKEIVSFGFNSKPVYYRRGDSAYIIYIGNVTGYTSLYMVSLTGSEPRLLVQGEKTDEFEAFHLFQNRMAISKDGILAFVTKSGDKDVLHLFDLTSEKLEKTLSFKDLVMLGSPSWAPDGKRIAISAINEAGNNDLYIIVLDSSRIIKLTNDYYDDRDPVWSPDGSAIVFTSDRTSTGEYGRYNLFSYDIETGRISYLIFGNESYFSPSWSPNGKYLAFTSDRDGTQNLYVLQYNSVGREEPIMRKVSDFTTAAFDPVWTNEGDLVFTVFDEFNFQIRMMKGVSQKLDSMKAHSYTCFDPTSTPWTAETISGEVSVSRLRYEKNYQLDIAQSQISTDPVFGTIGGAALSVSDVLGNDRYYFLLYNTAQTSSELLSSFNIAISRISMGQRTTYAYGIFNFSGRRYDLLDPDLYFFERAFGGYFAASYPLSKFRRIEGSVSLSSSDKEAIFEISQRKALLLTNSVSYVKDNALYYYTGPIDGNRFNLTLSYTTDIQYSNVNYFSVMTDYRRYFRLGMRSAMATRVELLYNHGMEARRFFMGGSWDLRGWPRWSIRGTKRWLTSAELRFPLLDRVGFDFPFGSINIGILRGAVFFDAGNCWDKVYEETLGSIGAGVRFSLFGILVLRYDFGKRIERNFTKLQDGMFQQFFFGWDF